MASSPEFVERADKDYVCVYIDNPEHDAAKAKVHDAAQNKKVTGDFEITVFPTVVVTDPRGRPFGVMDDYTLNGVSAFLPLMNKWEADGKTLFDLLEKSKESTRPGTQRHDARFSGAEQTGPVLRENGETPGGKRAS